MFSTFLDNEVKIIRLGFANLNLLEPRDSIYFDAVENLIDLMFIPCMVIIFLNQCQVFGNTSQETLKLHVVSNEGYNMAPFFQSQFENGRQHASRCTYVTVGSQVDFVKVAVLLPADDIHGCALDGHFRPVVHDTLYSCAGQHDGRLHRYGQ